MVFGCQGSKQYFSAYGPADDGQNDTETANIIYNSDTLTDDSPDTCSDTNADTADSTSDPLDSEDIPNAYLVTFGLDGQSLD